MPQTEVSFFQEDDGGIPVLEWLDEIRAKNVRAFRMCYALIVLLRQFGSELRRPRADYLRDGVYELRTRVGNVNYRILYGFVGKNAALLACGMTKEKTVPDNEIDRAVERIERFKKAPEKHRYIEEEQNDG
jgi:hypothetical protein